MLAKQIRAVVQFVLDIRLGLDLGRTPIKAIKVAWVMWGWKG